MKPKTRIYCLSVLFQQKWHRLGILVRREFQAVSYGRKRLEIIGFSSIMEPYQVLKGAELWQNPTMSSIKSRRPLAANLPPHLYCKGVEVYCREKAQ